MSVKRDLKPYGDKQVAFDKTLSGDVTYMGKEFILYQTAGWSITRKGEDDYFLMATTELLQALKMSVRMKTMFTKPYVLHAEANAITKVAKSNNSSDDSTLYVTTSPCMECSKLIIQSGIKRVVYCNRYQKNRWDLIF